MDKVLKGVRMNRLSSTDSRPCRAHAAFGRTPAEGAEHPLGGTTKPALKQAFVMLRPDMQWKNPVMFVVEVGAFLTLLFIVRRHLAAA